MVAHTPVLLGEVVEYLRPEPGQNFIDATLGGGGHAKVLAAKVLPGGRVLGIDRDQSVVERARDYAPNLTPVQGNYSEIAKLAQNVFPNLQISGVIIDCGLSSTQLADASRGFSFLDQNDGPLDMRLDQTEDMTAAYLINNWTETQLADLFRRLGEEPAAGRLAKQIVTARRVEPVTTTGQLAKIIAGAAPRRGRIHPATRVFQALRMEVNQELEGLSAGVTGALDILKQSGRLAIITFHSLEDRLIKQAFKLAQAQGGFKILTKHVVKPARVEVLSNPRARSAKLRVIEKL